MRRLESFFSILVLVLWFSGRAALAFDCTPWVYPEESPPKAKPDNEISARFAHGLLWEVTATSGVRSYLFGTIHLSDPRVLALATTVERKIVETQNFAMEVLITPATVRFSAARMFYPDEQRLSQILPPGLFAKTAALLDKHGVSREAADKLRPWAAYMTLAVPPADEGTPMDMYLLGIAERHGSNLHGIETIEEQLGIFEQLASPAQVSLLAESVCNYAENQAQIETMVSLYMEQNLRGLVALGERYQTPNNIELFEQLLFERNNTMAQRIKPWLTQGDFFIAVGALHLPGDSGLLQSLTRAGFTLRPVSDSPRKEQR